MMARRPLSIGSSADGRATTIVQTSTIPEIPGFQDDLQVTAWWVNTYKLVGDEVRQSVHDTEEPDPTTSNLPREVENAIDNHLWQVRAFVQRTPAGT